MLKGNKKYTLFLAIAFIALILLQIYAPKPINWAISYTKKEKIPYGTSALYTILPDLFKGQTIVNTSLPLYNTLSNVDIENHNYIIINNTFDPDTLDTRELLKFIANGNTAFISANNFKGKFADTMKLKTDNHFSLENLTQSDSSILSSIYKLRDTVKINFTNPALQDSAYTYTKGVKGTYFNSFDTINSIVLGCNEQKKVNFVKMKVGKGQLFIHTVPETFSNYHFVGPNNEYVYRTLSYLPDQAITWDEYYKAGNDKSDSPLRVIFNNPLLLKAYYLLILSIILFIIFGAKRKQRIIPVIEPYRNTTLQFVDIVGTLYYQTGNHKNIAEKKIIYFLEYIRTTFQTKTVIYDDHFIQRIANLSGIDQQEVHTLFYYFSDISMKQTVTQEELLKLNSIIENFHKQSKR
ncbi:MAG: DUF4350 domain-containing protein [Bacteroidota bacterium]